MDDRQDANWFYKVAGKECGPISTNELIDLVRRRKLFADEMVKLEKDGKWIFAGEIDGLFDDSAGSAAEGASSSQSHAASRTPSPGTRGASKRTGGKAASGAAADLIHNIHRRQFDSQKEIETEGLFSAGAGWFASIAGAAVERVVNIRDLIIEKLDLARGALSSRIVLGVVCLLLLAAVLRYVAPFGRASVPDAESKYSAVLSEFKELRQSNASDDVWTDFANRANAQLKPIIKQLESNADSQDQRAMALLWAGRDDFPKMIAEARKGISDSEKRFENRLGTAQRAAATSASSSNDIVTFLILVVDGLIVVAFVVFILARQERQSRL